MMCGEYGPVNIEKSASLIAGRSMVPIRDLLLVRPTIPPGTSNSTFSAHLLFTPADYLARSTLKKALANSNKWS